jgi:hypothetical protein
MEIKCAYTDLVDVYSLTPHPRNRNQHPQKQIEVLANLIKSRGFRHPIIVSKRSGYIVAGHGRLAAAHILGIEKVPVDYQDFETEADEYFFLVSDNEIARYAEFQSEKLKDDLEELDIDVETLDFEDLGLLDFSFPTIEDAPTEDVRGELEFSKELDEKNDYIVLLFNSKEDFKEAHEKLGIERIRMNLSESGENKNMEITGKGRIIEGRDVIARL